MGRASRLNPNCSADAVFVRSQIRAFLRRHPEQLKPLLKELGKPWGEVEAWMQAIDEAPSIENATDPVEILAPIINHAHAGEEAIDAEEGDARTRAGTG